MANAYKEAHIDPFLSFLHKSSFLSTDELYLLMQEQLSQNKAGDQVCEESGLVSANDLINARASYENTSVLKAEELYFNEQVVDKLGYDWCIKHTILPLQLKSGCLHVAVASIVDFHVKGEIQACFPSAYIQVWFASRTDILTVLGCLETETYAEQLLAQWTRLEGLDEKSRSEMLSSLLDNILRYALLFSASDLHFEPFKLLVVIYLRRDGVLKKIFCFHKKYWDILLARIKILCSMDVTNVLQPQNGKMVFEQKSTAVDLRVATHPTIWGERVAIRFLDRTLLQLKDLGFSSRVKTRVEKMMHYSEGLWVVAGPTGSGKTTTLYSLLHYLSHEEKSMITLEDPVERSVSFASQTSVCSRKKLTIDAGLASALRQDLDVLLVGEVRDRKTASMVMQSAMTGHQVLTSVHAPDASSVAERLIDLGVFPAQLSSYLRGIIVQRLLRRLCPHCKEILPFRVFGKNTVSQNFFSLYKKRGCVFCGHTGYKGRLPIAEMIENSPAVQKVILKGAHRFLFQRLMHTKTIPSLFEDAIFFLMQGEVSFGECDRVLGQNLFHRFFDKHFFIQNNPPIFLSSVKSEVSNTL